MLRNNKLVTVCLIMFAFAVYMFAGVNKSLMTDTAAVITNELENATNYGQIYLKFDGASENNAPRILINGEYACTVTEETKILDIFDMCVVELDTRALREPVLLSVEGKGENVVTDCVGRVITGGGGIDSVGTFMIKTVDSK